MKVKKKLTTHVGRHMFVTMFLQRGGKVEVLQQIMGHSDIQTTMIYTHVVNTDKVNSIKELDEYFRGHLAEWE